jgi:hypothetical protein
MHKGRVVTPMLSHDEVAYLLKKMQELRPDDNYAPDGKGRLRVTYHCSSLDASASYKREAYALIAEVMGPAVKRLVADYELLICNFYVKPPGTGEFTVHQNWQLTADLNDTTLTFWCPLVDIDDTNGALHVVEGSHKLLPHLYGPGAQAYFSGLEPALLENYLTPICVEAGHGIAFDDSLIHWSARNQSNAPRVALQAICIPVEATPALFLSESEKRFELIHADREFYLQNDITDLPRRQPHWKSMGFVENRNRQISRREFARLLKNGDEIRRSVYFPGEQTRPAPGKHRDWASRIAGMLRR